MAQPFRPWANLLARYTLVGVPVLIAVVVFAWVQWDLSPWTTEQDVYVSQPVPFSHEHHVSGLGIDCRYCHSTVEVAAPAGMPATHTCMSCHAQLWTESAMLQPVRASYRTNLPIQWQRVHDLPDYVYFNHSIHVNKGVGCETCHGRVDRMPLIRKEHALTMAWCLDCHRTPEQYLRPLEFIYAFGYDLPDDRQEAVGRRLVEDYKIDPVPLTDCSMCHR